MPLTRRTPVAPELLAWRFLRSLLVRVAPENDAERMLTTLYFVRQFVTTWARRRPAAGCTPEMARRFSRGGVPAQMGTWRARPVWPARCACDARVAFARWRCV